MANEMMIPASMQGGALSTKFQGAPVDNLGEGIRGGFAILGYRGKVWSTKYQGKEVPLMRDDGDGPRGSVEVVIVRAASNIAKIFYENGYEQGSNAPPDCWSTNGEVPDGAAPKKQSTTCAGCPKNAWGSKITEAGKQTKACADSKRLAIAPLADLANEAMGGPMLLRVPAASLKDLKVYGDQLQSFGYPYYAVATRIGFDANEAFPKFVFSATRPLTDPEAELVLGLRDDARVATILNTSVEVVHHEPEAAAVPASPFENGAGAKAPVQPVAQTAQTAPVQPVAQAAQTAPAQPVAQAAPAQPAQQKRTRRTKEEMAAAAAALAAQRNGGSPPVQPVQPQVVQQAPAAVAEPAIIVAAASEETAGDDFEDQLDSLLPA